MSTIAVSDIMTESPPSYIKEALDQWLSLDPSSKSFFEQISLKELPSFLTPDITFGTAGLRARVAPGWACMNNLTVYMASKGIANYILSEHDLAKDHSGIVFLGHDHRHGSREFASIAAGVYHQALAEKGWKVVLYDEPIATPLLAYAIRHEANENHVVYGVQVTASHNPASDNGYKVYGPTRSQVTQLTADAMAKQISHIKQEIILAGASSLCTRIPWTRPNTSSLGLLNKYCHYAKTRFVNPLLPILRHQTSIVYTPSHGVGGASVARLLPCLIHVPSQMYPDADFPTLPHPNPEEGLFVFEEAIKVATQIGSSIILANDPDADRLALAEHNSSTSWHLFTGNQLALMMAIFLRDHLDKFFPGAERLTVLASPVSSRALGDIAAMYPSSKLDFQVTQGTGFKSLASQAIATQQLSSINHSKSSAIFAFEEAIGYMVGTDVLDKDGLTSLLVCYAMIQEKYAQGISLSVYLDSIEQAYGYKWFQYNGYFTSSSMSEVRKAIEALEPHCTKQDGLLIFIIKAQGSSNSSIDVRLRASGTEPKLKYYAEVREKYGEQRGVDYTQIIRNAIMSVFPSSLTLFHRRIGGGEGNGN